MLFKGNGKVYLTIDSITKVTFIVMALPGLKQSTVVIKELIISLSHALVILGSNIIIAMQGTTSEETVFFIYSGFTKSATVSKTYTIIYE